MKEKIIEELKKKDFDFDNYIGVLCILDDDKTAMSQMLDYLDKNINATRNDIFEYAIAITNTQPDIIEIV